MSTYIKFHDIVKDDSGLVIPSVTFTVYFGGEAHTAGNKATLYSDKGITPLANPPTTGVDGIIEFFVDIDLLAAYDYEVDIDLSKTGYNFTDINTALNNYPIGGPVPPSGYLLANGTIPLTANWDVGAFDIRALTLTPDGLTSGRVVFTGTNGVLSDDANLVFDATNDRLGIGVTTALYTIHAEHTCTVADGTNLLRITGLQVDGTAMTGTLRGAYIDVSNGSTAATGTIRGLELKARTEAPGDTGNDVAVLEGLSISADSKGHSVTTMRAAEFICDGTTGGTITEMVGLRLANNLQANKATASFGLEIYKDSFQATADIRIFEVGGGGNYIGFLGPVSIATNVVWTLPDADGSVGQALITDGSGTLSWAAGGGGDITGPVSSTDNAVVRWDGVGGDTIQDSVPTVDDTGNLDMHDHSIDNLLSATITGLTAGRVVIAGAGGLLADDAGLTFGSNLLTVTKTAIGVTQGDYGLALTNTTAAASGAQQYSPAIRWHGLGWETDVGSSMAVDFRAFVRPIEGAAAPTGGLDFQASINGAAYSDLLTVLSTGNVGIGTTEPESLLHLRSGEHSLISERNSADVYSTQWQTRKSRGTPGSPAIIVNGDDIGYFVWQGYDGDQYHVAALMRVKTDGVIGNNDMPGMLVFGTTASGNTYPTVRMTIAANGLVNVVGEITAGTKTFRIDHPLFPFDKQLIHGTVEAPRYDLIYRGQIRLVKGKATIDVDTASGMTAGTFAVLCQNVVVTSLQNQTGYARCKPGTIAGGQIQIECEDAACTDLISWVVMAERKDPFVMFSSMCDVDGHLLVEVDKEEPTASDLAQLDDITKQVDKVSLCGVRTEIVSEVMMKKGHLMHPEARGKAHPKRTVTSVLKTQDIKIAK